MKCQKKYFVGIDIGSNESKGVIINHKCEIVERMSLTHDLNNPKQGWFEYDAEQIWGM